MRVAMITKGVIRDFFFLLSLTYGNSQTLNDSKRLRKDLLEGYDKFVRPVENQTKPVDVHFFFSLVAIQDFDEVQEKFSVTGVFAVFWQDESMRWESVEYGNITTAYMGYKDVWVPELILTNPSQKLDSFGKEWHIIGYDQNGVAFWTPGDLIKASCTLNVRYFPFDIQECDMELYVWGYAYHEVRLIPVRDDIDISHYRGEHVTWRLLNTSVKSEPVGVVYTATLTFHLGRKPQYVIVNVIMPILFKCFLNDLVFCLPAESGERVSYGISVLLAIAVFMTIVSDALPKQSEPLPLISYFLMICLIVSTLTSLFTILNLRIYHRSDGKLIPRWLCSMYRILACSPGRERDTGDGLLVENSEKTVTESETTVKPPELQKRNAVCEAELSFIDTNVDPSVQRYNPNESTTGQEKSISWKDISQMFDYILLTFFSLVTFISLLTFIMITNYQ